MYTGIITHTGQVLDVRAAGPEETRSFVIEVAPAIAHAVVGSSIAVQGTCLTVTRIEPGAGPDAVRYHFDAIPETLRKTNLGMVAAGDPVNIEGSLRLGDELGGHWVQGHVDGTGSVVERVETESGEVRLAVELAPGLEGQVLPKGSITVDGVSLTVGEVFRTPEGRERFHLYLIPHTLSITTLGTTDVGRTVNLELDVMGRWVAHHVEAWLARRDTQGNA